MDLPKNAFKAALKGGARQIGLWNTLGNPALVELLAGCGYDWLLIDTEHSPTAPTDTLALMQAAAGYPLSTIVRPGWNDAVEIKRVLDYGAQTLLIPYVQSRAEAEAAVAAVRYPPKGIRGMGGLTRASRWGAIPDYVARAEDEICLLVQAETAETLERVEEIAAVDGVDGIFIGPADLSASMGHPGDQNHPKVRAAILDAIARIRAAGKAPGILSLDQGFLRECEAAGAQFIAVGLDVEVLRGGAVARRDLWRDG